MKHILLGISIIWTAPLLSMNGQPSSARKIELIRIQDSNGDFFIVDPTNVDTSQVEVGNKVYVGFDYPNTHHGHIVGTITDIKYTE